MSHARTTYKLCHRWMRKLLAAGHPIPSVPPTHAGAPWSAARTVLLARASSSRSAS